MNAHDKKVLDATLEALATVLAEMPLPPGDYRIVTTTEKDFGGDREVKVIAEELPRELGKVRRRDPNPIEGHKLASLPFMKSKRAA